MAKLHVSITSPEDKDFEPIEGDVDALLIFTGEFDEDRKNIDIDMASAGDSAGVIMITQNIPDMFLEMQKEILKQKDED